MTAELSQEEEILKKLLTGDCADLYDESGNYCGPDIFTRKQP
jgi:hypothetical protein